MGTTVAQRNSINERTDDPVIREALVRKRLRSFRQDLDSLVLQELGLAHARVRVDVAVLNGVLHGYEIKSDRDNLNRLEIQLEIYQQALQKLTFVVAERHASNVIDIAPDWCGVLVVRRGPRGGLHFEVRRQSSRNPKVNRFIMAHLLWRDEVQSILASRGAPKSTLRMARAKLYEHLVEDVSESELVVLIKSAMERRKAWRGHLQPLLCDGCSHFLPSC